MDLPHYHGIGLATSKPVLTGAADDQAQEVTSG
jgi:hypothetical protein